MNIKLVLENIRGVGMLLTKEVKIIWAKRTKGYYIKKGYKYTGIGDEFTVKVSDLSKGCHKKILIKCDNCKKEFTIEWKAYLKNIKDNNIYYCKQCMNKLFGVKQRNRNQLKKGKSFYDWCIENNHKDILDRWDYDLNNYSPKDVCFSSHTKYYFKCSRGIHKSEKHSIHLVTIQNRLSELHCRKCNTIGTYLKKNNLLYLWSEKNNKSPYEYSLGTSQKAWFKCPNKKHADFYRKINNSIIYNFRCPECQYSKGEERINNWLIANDFKKDIDYIPQKEFDGLIGLNGGNLSYDFYLPNDNLLIEYQGEQHIRYIPEFQKNEEGFYQQKEHDRRKKEYAKNNNIDLLEIWYYDFNNVEKILDKNLKLIKDNEQIENKVV